MKGLLKKKRLFPRTEALRLLLATTGIGQTINYENDLREIQTNTNHPVLNSFCFFPVVYHFYLQSKVNQLVLTDLVKRDFI